MRISDWSSDVCSSDLQRRWCARTQGASGEADARGSVAFPRGRGQRRARTHARGRNHTRAALSPAPRGTAVPVDRRDREIRDAPRRQRRNPPADFGRARQPRSEEHTSELQPLMRITYDVFCLKTKQNTYKTLIHTTK